MEKPFLNIGRIASSVRIKAAKKIVLRNVDSTSTDAVRNSINYDLVCMKRNRYKLTLLYSNRIQSGKEVGLLCCCGVPDHFYTSRRKEGWEHTRNSAILQLLLLSYERRRCEHHLLPFEAIKNRNQNTQLYRKVTAYLCEMGIDVGSGIFNYRSNRGQYP